MSASDIRILVVDDHALVREMLAARLQAEPGFRVVGVAANAGEALGIVTAQRPDIVLMDVDMPGLSAFDAARTIRETHPETAVLFVSGYLNDSYVEQALALEAAGYVSKAESPEAMVRAVAAVAQGAIYFSPQVRKRLVVDEGGPRLRDGPHARIEMLTPREKEILRYLAQGLQKKEVARLAGISPKTVDQHCMHIMDKLDLHDRVALARFAIREGMIEA